MTRRTLIDLAARAAALTAGAEFFAAWLKAGQAAHSHANSAPPEPLRKYTPSFFDEPDREALDAFTSILIPTDDTPGAREANCVQFIDFVVSASPAEVQKQWRDAMKALKDAGFHA